MMTIKSVMRWAEEVARMEDMRSAEINLVKNV
jgi:hypothetical protein